MKSIMYYLFIEPFSIGWLEIILGSILWVMSLIIFGLIAWGTFYLIDYSFLKQQQDKGIVIDQWICPAHNSTSFVMTGKVMIPITTHYNTSWHLDIEINGLKDDVSVSKSYFDLIDIGDSVNCEYVNGRLSNYIYIKNILN